MCVSVSASRQARCTKEVHACPEPSLHVAGPRRRNVKATVLLPIQFSHGPTRLQDSWVSFTPRRWVAIRESMRLAKARWLLLSLAESRSN